jgi:hypothetical protein
MATDQRNLPAYLGDDATFRTWGSGLAAQLAAIGLVKTADTGQINWATVTRPVSALAGYEIWRFNDTLQATKPVFVRVDYGALGDRPWLEVRVGTNTNGAGTLTGQVGTLRDINGNASKTAGVTLPSYCSGSSSRLNLCTNLDAASSSFSIIMLIERTKTSAGVDTGDGIVTFDSSAAGTKGFQVIPFTGTIPSSASISNMAISLASGGASKVGTNVALSPTIAPVGKLFFASWCAYVHADLTELVPVQVDHLGATRTFLPLGDGVTSTRLTQGDYTGHSLAILWE